MTVTVTVTVTGPNPYHRVLALETSTTLGGVALLEGGVARARLAVQMAGAHSRRLLAEAERLLEQEGLTFADLDLLVASRGPGSFTGLRIGLATVKGLALASGLPVCGVSSLRTLARSAIARDGLVATALDARKAEVYAALYRLQQGVVSELLPETVERPAVWAARVAELAAGEPVLWLGNGLRAFQQELLAPCAAGSRALGPEFDTPDPLLLALLGREQAQRSGPDDLAALEPIYLRPPTDAKPLRPLA